MAEDWLTVVLVAVFILVVWWRARPNDTVWRDF